MRSWRELTWLLFLAAWLPACPGALPPKPPEHRFYKQADVRRCLDLEKEKRITESQACWADLVQRLDTQPDFVERAELTEADQTRIRQKAGQADKRAGDLGRDLDRCLNQTARDRVARRTCLEAYLAKHGGELTRTERYEIEQSIAGLEGVAALARGEVEATLEHAGRLLGARLLPEEDGVRLDELVAGGPLAQAGCPAQGLVVELDGLPVSSLDAAERIARLEACEDRPLGLLVRHGDLASVTFLRAEVRCGAGAGGRQVESRQVPPESCSLATSPELRLGVAWCLDGRTGELVVWEVCAGSPAATAGLRPEQRLTRVNGTRLLGLGPDDVARLLAGYPATPISLEDQAGHLQSPAPVSGPAFPPDKIERCWQAIRQREEEDGTQDDAPPSAP